MNPFVGKEAIIIEEHNGSISVVSFFWEYRLFQERYNGEQKSVLQRKTNDEKHWSITDAYFNESRERQIGQLKLGKKQGN